MKKTLQIAWRTRGILARILWPFSRVYGLLTASRRELYRRGFLASHRVAVPVIVVGNVTVGGGGKTPLVMALLAHFTKRGMSPGVVSRGYGRRGTGCLEVMSDTPVHESGDEPALIKRAQAAPVFVANDRIQAARALLAAYPLTRVIISDDGLQHDRLQRTLNIVVFDDSGLGNGWMIPAGPLRQPWPLASRTVPMLVLHTGRQSASAGLMCVAGFTSQRQLADAATGINGVPVLLASLSSVEITSAVPGALIALAGIAHPEAFFGMLTARGIPLARTVSLADHADFSGFDLSSLRLPGEARITVLCTEKDAVKLFELPQDPNVRVLAVPLLFAPENAFFAALDQALGQSLESAVDRP